MATLAELLTGLATSLSAVADSINQQKSVDMTPVIDAINAQTANITAAIAAIPVAQPVNLQPVLDAIASLDIKIGNP